MFLYVQLWETQENIKDGNVNIIQQRQLADMSDLKSLLLVTGNQILFKSYQWNEVGCISLSGA